MAEIASFANNSRRDKGKINRLLIFWLTAVATYNASEEAEHPSEQSELGRGVELPNQQTARRRVVWHGL